MEDQEKKETVFVGERLRAYHIHKCHAQFEPEDVNHYIQYFNEFEEVTVLSRNEEAVLLRSQDNLEYWFPLSLLD